jgi:hypothetical protein
MPRVRCKCGEAVYGHAFPSSDGAGLECGRCATPKRKLSREERQAEQSAARNKRLV